MGRPFALSPADRPAVSHRGPAPINHGVGPTPRPRQHGDRHRRGPGDHLSLSSWTRGEAEGPPSTRACISHCGLSSPASKRKANSLNLSEVPSAGPGSIHLPSWNPRRDSDRSRHWVYVMHTPQTVDSNQRLPSPDRWWRGLTRRKSACCAGSCTRALRYYLQERSFTLCSDRATLQWLRLMEDTKALITRWNLALQVFKVKVIHMPGGTDGGGRLLLLPARALGFFFFVCVWQ